MVLSYLLNVKHNKLYEEHSTFLNSGYFRYKTVDVNQDNTRLYIRVSQLRISLLLKKRVLGNLGPLWFFCSKLGPLCGKLGPLWGMLGPFCGKLGPGKAGTWKILVWQIRPQPKVTSSYTAKEIKQYSFIVGRIWLTLRCWGNSSIPEGRFSKWF